MGFNSGFKGFNCDLYSFMRIEEHFSSKKYVLPWALWWNLQGLIFFLMNVMKIVICESRNWDVRAEFPDICRPCRPVCSPICCRFLDLNNFTFFFVVSDNQLLFIKKNPTRCNNISSVIIPYLYEAQHVSGDTSPIIRSLKLHWQSLGFHTWKVIGRVVGGRCQAHTVPDNVHQLHVQTTFHL